MERRIFLAIILAAVVMYGWQAFFMPPPPATKSNASQQASTKTPTPSAPAAAPAAPSVESEAKPTPAAPQAVKAEQAEREIVVDTAVAKIVLTNRGGRALHWQLKESRTPDGSPVDLIPSNSPADQPRPFSLRVDDAQVTQRLNESLYQVSGDVNGRVDATTSSARVTFEFEDAAGLRVRKELRFEPRSFVVSFSAD